MTVLAGRGHVSGGDDEREVEAGDALTIAPGEPHGMRAPVEELVIAALIAPRPGGH